LEKALASELAARQQTTASLEQERLAHTKTEAHLEAAQALAAESAGLQIVLCQPRSWCVERDRIADECKLMPRNVVSVAAIVVSGLPIKSMTVI
jgi:hypothetical protein